MEYFLVPKKFLFMHVPKNVGHFPIRFVDTYNLKILQGCFPVNNSNTRKNLQ